MTTSWRCALRAAVAAVALAAVPAFAADEVDFAVDAVAAAGSIAGVTVGGTEKALVKGLVRCAVRNTDWAACGRTEAIRHLPPEAQPFAHCLATGMTAERCGSEEMLRRLPGQARDMASCLAQRPDVGRCVERAGQNTLQRQALQVIDKLKADGRSSLGEESSGAIRNIVGVAKGIREDDWGSVLRHGGPEVYKAAVKIVLNILLPGLGPVIDRVTEAVVQSRVDLVEGLTKAIRARDQQKITELSLEFYLAMNVIAPCSIVPPGDFKLATCGNIGKAVRILAETGGELTDFAVHRVEDALDLVGIDTGRPFVSACGTSANFYASRYMRCLHKGTFRAVAQEEIESVVASLNNRCRRHYGGPPHNCHQQSSLTPICQPLNQRFRADVLNLSRGLESAARSYTRSLRVFVQSKGRRACDADFDRTELRQFVDQCESSLKTQIPLFGDPTTNDPDCQWAPRQFSAPSAHRLACENELQRVPPPALRDLKGRVCRQSQPARPVTPSGPIARFEPDRTGGMVAGAALANARRCRLPHVPREARPGDQVCVPERSRALVAKENRSAATRAHRGTTTCMVPYVWREAFEGDGVCVSVQRREAVREENRLDASRRMGG
jgi:hypothetical protein